MHFLADRTTCISLSVSVYSRVNSDDGFSAVLAEYGAVICLVELHCAVPESPGDCGAKSRVHVVLWHPSWVRRARPVAVTGDQADGVEFLGAVCTGTRPGAMSTETWPPQLGAYRGASSTEVRHQHCVRTITTSSTATTHRNNPHRIVQTTTRPTQPTTATNTLTNLIVGAWATTHLFIQHGSGAAVLSSCGPGCCRVVFFCGPLWIGSRDAWIVWYGD